MIARLALIVLAAALAAAPAAGRAGRQDGGAIPAFAAAERELLDRGGSIVRLLPAEPREITLACAIGVRTTAGGFLKWARSYDQYQRGSYSVASGRFSNPPRLADLDTLRLNDADLKELRHCSAGDCGLKLSSAEMDRLRAAAADGARWQASTQKTFRELILARAQAYAAGGQAAVPPYNDEKLEVSPGSEFTAILTPPDFMSFGVPELAEYLASYPHHSSPEVESYLYWSVETLSRKPIVSITHVAIFWPSEPWAPEVVVAARNAFASHYFYAGLAITALGRAAPGKPRDLIYRHRARVDMLTGPFGGWIRRGIQKRVSDEAPGVLQRLRDHLEGLQRPSHRHNVTLRTGG